MRIASQGRWLRMLALIAALTLMAAACGDDGGENGNGNGDATEAPGDGGTEGPGTDAPELETVEEGVLTVGTDIPYPPFEFREGGEETGFDIDLMDEVATRLGLETTYVDTDFDTIFTQLATGRFDTVIAASTITPEREKQVNFSDPYYNSQQSLTVNTACDAEPVASIDDLGEDHSVGVQSGTTGESYVRDNVEPNGAEVKSFPEGPDAYAQLEACQLDAVVNDEPTAIAEVAAREDLELVETIDTGEAYGIAVNPENEELLDAINETLAEIIEDGTYEEIYGKYPDLPPGGNIVSSEG